MLEKENEPIDLHQWSDFINGARAAIKKINENYVNIKFSAADRPYIEAEMRFIMESKENTWKWLKGDKVFHYRKHKKSKGGTLIFVEAYLDEL